MTDCKAIPAGGGHGGAAGLYCTVADRTIWVREVYPSRQDIYIINVSECVCMCVCAQVYLRGSKVT